ncbi:RNA 2',3'-cyclic phosphodiesterase [Desulfovibrio ferrophilus]|uniref:RNA 2',3'-cyclic phosphodiesterase n=1 Tax=Desulfovibrio ferrophilus TaxID=241368 RepID=A0A2Z6B2Q9_9BACT|nr:RNA 2',3'-cyclic phosphodiesterase [Desulfovibrio ferrophilus]BBD09725.1 2'-5' RNA ligase [Desulfovibrio ferrophilus]
MVAPDSFRLFVGVALPALYQDGLAKVSSTWSPRLKSKVTWTRPANAHLTLKFLGNVAPSALDDVKHALTGVEFAPFVLQAGGCGAFPAKGRPAVLWLGLERGAEKLAKLAASVDQTLKPLGFAPEGKPFHPHLTLLRVRLDKKASQTREARSDPWPEMMEGIARERWEAFALERFTLFRSVLGPDGPRYTALVDFGATSL